MSVLAGTNYRMLRQHHFSVGNCRRCIDTLEAYLNSVGTFNCNILGEPNLFRMVMAQYLLFTFQLLLVGCILL